MAEVEIFKIEVDKADASAKLVQVRKQLAESTKVRNELNKKIKEGTTLTKQETIELGQAEKQISKNRTEQKQLVKQISAENNSLQQLRNELSKLKVSRNNQETQTESGRKAFKKVTAEIDRYNESIKRAEEAGGDFGRSVGNYKKGLGGVPSVGKKVSGSFNAVGTAMKAIPLLFIIELIKKFIGLLTQNAEVAEFLEDALSALNNVVGILVENIVELGKLYIDVVTGQKSFSDALTEGTERVKGLGSALEGAAKEGYEASKALRQVSIDTAKLSIETNKTQRAIEEQLTALANQGASLEERKKAGQEASRLITEQLDKEIELEKRRLQATQLANNATKNSTEDKIKELEIQAEIENLEAQKVARQKEVLGQVSGIEKQVRTEQLKTVNDRRKAELELDNFRKELIANEELGAIEKTQALIEIERNRLEIALQAEGLYQEERVLLEEQTAERIRQIRNDEINSDLEGLRVLSESAFEIRKNELDNLIEIDDEKKEIRDKAFFDNVENQIKIADLEAKQTARVKAEADTRTKIAQLQSKQEIQAVQSTAGAVASLLNENTVAYKIAKTTEAVISTFTAINKTLAEPTLPFPSNVITAGVIGAQGALNVASISAAAGGGEFMTTKPTLLMVGDNPTGTERITVEPVNSMGKTTVSNGGGLIKMAGGGTLVTGNSDQGAIQATAGGQGFDVQALANAMKGIELSVGVKEINKKQNRITAKENIGKLNRG